MDLTQRVEDLPLEIRNRLDNILEKDWENVIKNLPSVKNR
jgi:hypothetical protein